MPVNEPGPVATAIRDERSKAAVEAAHHLLDHRRQRVGVAARHRPAHDRQRLGLAAFDDRDRRRSAGRVDRQNAHGERSASIARYRIISVPAP